MDFMKLRTMGADDLARAPRNRIAALESERRKLLQAHYAGAIPLDLMKEAQDRITRQLADAGAALANTEIDWGVYEGNINAAIGPINRLQVAYERARPTTRRKINQAAFKGFRVDKDGCSLSETERSTGAVGVGGST